VSTTIFARALTSALLLAGTTLATAPLHAETSSWSSGPALSKPSPPKPAGGAAKPDAATKAPPALSGPGTSTHSKTGPSGTGDDEAYLAFDRGSYLTALSLAEAAAARGEPTAHTLIGRIYSEGLGVPRDDKRAAEWFAKGAKLGDVNAEFAIGLMKAEGRGIAKDLAAAAAHFETAAKAGHPAANYNLGLLFLKGEGKPENPYRAAAHIGFAAEKGLAAAQYDLGTLYQHGVGVPNDAAAASRWIRAAADQGMAVAKYEYAVMLLRGLGLTADEPKAIGYLKAAAEEGIAGAQNRLAHVYKDGIGVDKSLTESAKWRLIAKANGVTDETLDKEIAKLPKADRAQAEKAASEWRERRGIGLLE
jgi:hypothetical protein